MVSSVVLELRNVLLREYGAGADVAQALAGPLPSARGIRFLDGRTLSFTPLESLKEAAHPIVFDAQQRTVPKQPLEIARTIHSFDPRIACAVHLSAPGDQELLQLQVL